MLTLFCIYAVSAILLPLFCLNPSTFKASVANLLIKQAIKGKPYTQAKAELVYRLSIVFCAVVPILGTACVAFGIFAGVSQTWRNRKQKHRN